MIKVLRPERAEWYAIQRFGLLQKRRRYRGLSGFLQEIREQFAVHAAEGRPSPHLQNIVGLVDTDRGFGVVIEALRGRDGGYAPTLASLVKEGRFDAAARRDLDIFFEWLLRSPLVVTDLTWGNLLYAHAEGADRFVLIDGVGESAALPLRSLFDAINRRSKRGRIRALLAKIAGWQPPAI